MSVAEAVRQDVRGALRALGCSPGFAAAALVTLSLGIGATSAIFSVFKTVLLTPLPYDAPERRVMVWSRWVGFATVAAALLLVALVASVLPARRATKVSPVIALRVQ